MLVISFIKYLAATWKLGFYFNTGSHIDQEKEACVMKAAIESKHYNKKGLVFILQGLELVYEQCEINAIFCSTLETKVKELTELGATALGPGLALCVGMVSMVPRSEVVLCTDGLPNRGIGALQNSSSNYDPDFYSQVSHHIYH